MIRIAPLPVLRPPEDHRGDVDVRLAGLVRDGQVEVDPVGRPEGLRVQRQVDPRHPTEMKHGHLIILFIMVFLTKL